MAYQEQRKKEMAQRETDHLLELYLPPKDGLALESLIATTYNVDWDFVEEELLRVALGVRSPVSRLLGFRSELERRLERTDVSIIFDLRGAERQRLSPRIDPIPIAGRKQHTKISLLLWSGKSPSLNEPYRQARLIIGSANLTQMGFRQNYEVVSVLDFGMRESAPKQFLLDAVSLIRELTAGIRPSQLETQLNEFDNFAGNLHEVDTSDLYPWRFVKGDNLIPSLQEAWKSIGKEPPNAIKIASPFLARRARCCNSHFENRRMVWPSKSD